VPQNSIKKNLKQSVKFMKKDVDLARRDERESFIKKPKAREGK
jgi:hypothetical protein